MWLNGDEIVEASLLWPADNRPRVLLTLEEEAVLLGDRPEPQEAQKVTMSPHECPETPKAKEATEQSNTPKSTCPFIHGIKLP